MDLATPLQFVKGIGPARAGILCDKGLETVADLLYYPPFRYEDRRNIKPIRLLAPGEKAVVLARIEEVRTSGSRRFAGVLEATLQDGSGGHLTARWFHGERLADSLVSGTRVALFGKIEPDRRPGRVLIVQPELEILSDDENGDELLHVGRIVPVYEAAGKITTRVFRKLLDRILKEADLPDDPLPPSIVKKLQFPDLSTAIHAVHAPGADANVDLLNAFRTPAQHRLIFDEFFWLECGLAIKKRHAQRAEGISFIVSERARDQIRKMLPFKPTGAQRRVIQEIADDMKQPHPMNRLLQGDVGSGKTIVAAQAAIIAMENGYQAAVLAPTEILALQHFNSMRALLEPLGYVVAALTGSATTREKQQIKGLAACGMAHMIVGTHALLQEDVSFARLGLVIIDEQHRFGVRQRLALMQKGKQPDVLVMTATPIPRTLAMTIYGDLDLSSIDEMPPGRRPIVTRAVSSNRIEQVYSFIGTQVRAGRQVYIVYPLVEETETTADVKAAENAYQQLSEIIFPGVEVALLHGRLPPEVKESVMQQFQRGDVKILVATTVIEVGVDVPNATLIVIEHAERFGLAQLHQLRGRVGRGTYQSYCILVMEKMNDVSRERIRTLVDSNDGFHIAEMDMKLRGPGEFYGTRQSGLPGLRVADLMRDSDILADARSEAQALVSDETRVAEAQAAARYVKENWQRKYGLVQVG